MYSLSDQMRENVSIAIKLDNMVTVGKEALEEIIKILKGPYVNKKINIELIANRALLKIEKIK